MVLYVTLNYNIENKRIIMSRKILTKTQAISVLIQISQKQDIDIFGPVDKNHVYFQLSCTQLEEKIWQYISQEEVVAVVEEI